VLPLDLTLAWSVSRGDDIVIVAMLIFVDAIAMRSARDGADHEKSTPW
jgi:hypothetical protein